MTTKEKKLKDALEISKLVTRINYYKQPLSVIKGNKKKLMSSSFEIRIDGIKGSIYGELDYGDVVYFLNKKAKQENINLDKLLK